MKQKYKVGDIVTFRLKNSGSKNNPILEATGEIKAIKNQFGGYAFVEGVDIEENENLIFI